MTTKTRPGYTMFTQEVLNADGSYNSYITAPIGASTISYADGPKYIQGHCNWKSCDHSFGLRSSGTWNLHYSVMNSANVLVRDCTYRAPSYRYLSGSSPVYESSKAMRDLRDKFGSILNLNGQESALFYSNVVQMIPMLGACRNVNKVFRSILTHFKRYKNKPFTSLIKEAISLDFINRFVIKPTIADAQMIANAFDWAIMQVTKAQLRNERLQPYTMTTSVTNRGISGSYEDYIRTGSSSSSCPILYSYELGSQHSYTLHVMGKVAYDIDTINPVKLAMKRVGLTRPLGSIWDLVPFSFVCDYFFRVGDFIEMLDDQYSNQDSLEGRLLSISNAWITEKSVVYNKAKPISVSRPSGYWAEKITNWSQNLVDHTWEQGTFKRYPAPSLACLPTGSWDSYTILTSKLSSTRIRTLAELVIQAKL